MPRSDALKISSPTKTSRLQRVVDLMLHNPRRWNNEPLVRQIFLFDEAEEILCIRIPEIEDLDILSWHFEKNGIFSVQSAYKLAVENTSPEICGSSISVDKKNRLKQSGNSSATKNKSFYLETVPKWSGHLNQQITPPFNL